MQGHGHDESAPTPGGMNVGRFGSVHWVFTERSQRIGSLYVT